MYNINQSAQNQNQQPQAQYQPFRQGQDNQYFSQIGSNDGQAGIQLQHIINMIQQPNPQQQQAINQSQEYLKCCMECCGLCCLFIINNFFSLVFGTMFYMFQGDPQKYNYCSNESLRSWGFITSIILFINCGVSLLKVLEKQYSKQENLTYCLNACIVLALIIDIFGLTANISSDCGQLYLLSFIFCLFFYIVLGIIIIIILIIILIRKVFQQ
ncbi:hypothetical protein ABPG73_008498 [Tetrahymena malaccensis]